MNHRIVSSSKNKPEDGDLFMVSFSSLMILLLTFMILMVTLASFREPRFKSAMGSVRGALSALPHAGGKSPVEMGGAGFLPEEILGHATSAVEMGGAGFLPEEILGHAGSAEGEDKDEEDKEQSYEQMIQKIKKRSEMPDLAGLEIEESEAGLAIRVSDALMFERGEADLKYDILPVLDLVAKAVRAKPGRVSIIGNTCDLPISTHKFPSNWELSIVRAVNVLHYLESRAVPPESLFAYGLADQCPLAPNDSEANRQKNRRVEIFVRHPAADTRSYHGTQKP